MPRPAIPFDILTAITYREAQKLAELATGRNVLELGSDLGFSTVVMAQTANLVCSIDWHEDRAGSWDVFCGNIKRYGVADKVYPVRGRFETILPAMARMGLRFGGVFIDGDHKLESVQRDLDLTLPLVGEGGFVAFHDYGRGPHNGFPGFGVTEVADRFGVDGVVDCLAWSYI